MKRLILLTALALLLTLSGCSASDPSGYNVVLGTTSEGTEQPARLDTNTRALVFVTSAEHEIHKGNSYSTSNVTDLANAQVLDFLILVGSVPTHFEFHVSHELEASLNFYQAPTITANGTSMAVFNRLRSSGNTNTTLAFVAPTVTATGTLIASYQQGSGRTEGGESRDTNEWILSPNTYYLFRVTNKTANSNVITVKFDWIERTALAP